MQSNSEKKCSSIGGQKRQRVGRWALGVARWALGVGRDALGVGRDALGVTRWARRVGRYTLCVKVPEKKIGVD